MFAARPTRMRARERPRAQERRTPGSPTSLSTPVVAARGGGRGSRAPRRSRGRRRRRSQRPAAGSAARPRQPADERQPQPAVVAPLRAEGEQDVAQLAAAVEEAAAGRAPWRGARARARARRSPSPRVARRPPSSRVSQPKPAASGKTGLARPLRQAALARERLPRAIARTRADQPACTPVSRSRSHRPASG